MKAGATLTDFDPPIYNNLDEAGDCGETHNLPAAQPTRP
jgi:hypothetical protein